ncbi:DoxX family protein [Arcobacter sp. 15-2]|uniref:DoxX family protein n=1 Tax=Arcobacter sp. 15-2 TaxID=3374109 RepID=UPI00399D4210
MKKILYIVFKYLLGILFVLGGIAHFTKTEFYLKAMPEYLPLHEFIVYASGVLEIVLGILLLINKTTRKAAIGIIVLLIAVFPANIHMYLNYTDFPDMSETALLIRLPIQLILIAWAYVYTIKKDEK